MKKFVGIFILFSAFMLSAQENWEHLEYYDGKYQLDNSLEGDIYVSSYNNNNKDFFKFSLEDMKWQPALINSPSMPYKNYKVRITDPPYATAIISDFNTGEVLKEATFIEKVGQDISFTVEDRTEKGIIFYGGYEVQAYVLMMNDDLELILFETPESKFNLLETFALNDFIILKIRNQSGTFYLKFDFQGKLIESYQQSDITIYDIFQYGDKLLVHYQSGMEYKIGFFDDDLNLIEDVYEIGMTIGTRKIVDYEDEHLLILDYEVSHFIDVNIITKETHTLNNDMNNSYFVCGSFSSKDSTYFIIGQYPFTVENFNPNTFNEKRTLFYLYNADSKELTAINDGLTSFKVKGFYDVGILTSAYLDPHTLIYSNYSNSWEKIDSAIMYPEPEAPKLYTAATQVIPYYSGQFWMSETGKGGYYDLITGEKSKVTMPELPEPQGMGGMKRWILQNNSGKIILNDRNRIAELDFDAENMTVGEYEFGYTYNGSDFYGIQSVKYLEGNYYMLLEGKISRSADLSNWEAVTGDDIVVSRVISDQQWISLFFADDEQNIYEYNANNESLRLIADDISEAPFYIKRVTNVFYSSHDLYLVVEDYNNPNENQILKSDYDDINWVDISEGLPKGKYNSTHYSTYQQAFYVNIDGYGIYRKDLFTSVEDAESLPQPKIYPQPAKNIVNFDISMMSLANSDVEIFDLQGKKIDAFKIAPGSQSFTFSTADLNPGIYFIRLDTAEGNKLYKFNVE